MKKLRFLISLFIISCISLLSISCMFQTDTQRIEKIASKVKETKEFSDGSKVIFDRYYKEIEENLDAFHKHFSIWSSIKMRTEDFLWDSIHNGAGALYFIKMQIEDFLRNLKQEGAYAFRLIKMWMKGDVESEKNWIEIRLLDQAGGKPIPQRKYTIKFDDGTERTGITDDDGFLFEDDIPSGNYELIFDGIDNIDYGEKFPYKRSKL